MGVGRYVDQRGLELAQARADETGLIQYLGHHADPGARQGWVVCQRYI
jgi:hypothetical protein